MVSNCDRLEGHTYNVLGVIHNNQSLSGGLSISSPNSCSVVVSYAAHQKICLIFTWVRTKLDNRLASLSPTVKKVLDIRYHYDSCCLGSSCQSSYRKNGRLIEV